jgi:hypothetical protein
MELGATPAFAATAPTWVSGQYFAAIQNVPFCDDVAVASGTTLPLTSITVGATPSGFTGYSIKSVNLAAGTAQVCGTDTNAPVSSGTPPALKPVATNSAGSATDSIPIGSYGACTWTSSKGTTSKFDSNTDLYTSGSQSSFGAPITNGESLGSTSNYPTCSDVMVSASGGLGDAWTINTANPLPSPTDSNPSATQGDLPSSNLFLGSGGCYGAVNILSSYSYTNFGSGTSLTTPSPWVNGGTCTYGSLGSNQAGGNTDATNANCPPSQADVDAGYVSCSITASSGNDENGSVNYSTDDLFYTGQPVPQQSTATLSTSAAVAGGTVSVTGGTNWWGSSDGAPNVGPYGDSQAGSFYQVSAPSVYIGTSRATAVPVVGSTVAIGGNSYACTGAESATVGPNPCTLTPGQPTGSFQVPSGLAPGTYNVYIDESNTTSLPGNGPNDSYQTARGTSLGTAESVSTLVVGTAPTISSSNSAAFTSGSSGSFTVTTTGSPNPALTESGALPSGVSFVDNGDGTATLAGTTSTTGSFPITITATNGVGSPATQSFTLTVDAPAAITSAASTSFTQGSAGTFTATSTGYPTSSLSESGSLPTGVSFVDNGNGTATLAGTPATGTAGSYPVTITAANGVGSPATQSFTLTVTATAAITSSASTSFTSGSSGSFTVTSTGSPTPSLTETGSLPSGVSFVDNGDGTATLAGATSTTGSFPITLTATNGVGSPATQTFTLTVTASAAVTSTDSATFTSGSAGSLTVTSTGYPTPSLTESGALPSGVSFVDNGDGTATLAGATSTTGSFPITITATNGVASPATQSFTLTVDAAASITSADSTTFTEGSAGTFTVTSTGYPTAALTESGALPTGVSFVDNGNGTAGLSGRPATGTAGSYPLTITATNGVGSPATQPYTLTVSSAPLAPSITSGGSTTFTEGSAGTFTVTSTGNPTATLSESGTLPTGVSFVDNGDGTATLTGTPAAGTAGSYPLTITATNGVGGPATQSFTLTVDAAAAITSGSSATFTTGSSGTFTVTSTGYPTAALSETGALPSGVTFTDNGNGTATLAGSPSAGTAGSYPLTITATNGVGSPATQSFTLTVNAPAAITSATGATFAEGSAGTFTVTSTGSPTAGLTESGALPTGVTFTDNGNGTATLAGSPSAGTAGSYPLTITATNGVGSPAAQSFALTVDSAPAITSADHAAFTATVPGSFTVASTGNPAPTVTESGALPSGVTFSGGVLSGTPAAGTAGSYPITITATNGVGSPATQAFTLTVSPAPQAPSINSAGHTTFTAGSAGTFTVTSTGNPTAALAESGALPSGVTFTDNGDGTGTLAGTPATGTGGVYTVTLTASNGVGSPASQSFSLTVDEAPAITSADAASLTVGRAGSFTVTATGTPAPTVAESGALPTGVTFSSGVLSGTPAAGTTGSYPLTFTATNGVGSPGVQSFTLTVDSVPAITSANNTTFVEGSPGTFTVTATGYPAPTTTEWGNLPHGVTFSGGVLSGTPTQSGTYPVVLTASNGVSPNATQIFTLTVSGLHITTVSLPNATVGTPYSLQLTATGGVTPFVWKAHGRLPKGFKLSKSGLLTGPANASKMVAGTYTVGVQVTDATLPKPHQTVTGSFAFTIAP